MEVLVHRSSRLLLLALGLPACGEPAPPKDDPGAVDADGDGAPAAVDCDDGDGDVAPGALERCDGVDQDCDGTVDEAATDALVAYTDADGDGWGIEDSAVVTCDTTGLARVAGDCDDGDPGVHPEAFDAVADGLDQDCEGGDADCEDAPVLYEGTVELVGDLAAAALAELCRSWSGVTGNLVIYGATGQLDLDASCLCAVEGDVVLDATDDLATFTLGGEVAGELVVRNNLALTRVAIGGSVGSAWVEGNTTLTDASAQVAEDGSLYLHANTALLAGPDCAEDRMRDVVVSGNDAILRWSCSVERISRDLQVRDNGALTYVNLEDLRAIEGSFVLANNSALRSWEASALISVSGDVEVSGNDAWEGAWDESCSEGEGEPLPLLDRVGGAFTVRDNGALHALCAEIPGLIDGDLVVEGNDALVTVGLPDSLHVGGDLVLRDLPSLRTAEAGTGVEIGGDLVVEEAGDLDADYAMGASVTSIGGDLRLVGRTPADWSLGEVRGGLEIFGAPDGVSITVDRISGGVRALGVSGTLRIDTTDIGGDIDVVGVDRLDFPTLAAFPHTLDVDGGLGSREGACSFPALTELGALLLSVDVDADLDGCFPVLASLGGLSLEGAGLTRAPTVPSLLEIDGSLTISGDALTDLSGLSSIRSLTGDLLVLYTGALADLTGLDGIETVDQSVRIRDNVALRSLDGLATLATIGVDLDVSANDALTDVSALHALSSVGGDVSVSSNTALPTADAEALVLAIGSIGGTTWVEYNGP
ncbi:MAG: putative metal-binding motif-containing protein [Pseudomonadota bacterium]|nr:putative metal-binding motif-containing protein [Pseudomonadota bacterium]